MQAEKPGAIAAPPAVIWAYIKNAVNKYFINPN